MTSNVLCRYYQQGACAFGDKCRFSHNMQDEASQVCKYYLAGNCAYGDTCRYQHSKPGWSSKGQPAPASNYSAPSGVHKPPVGGSSAAAGSMVKLPSGASEFGMVEAAPNWDDYMTPDEMDEFEQWQAEQAGASMPGGRSGSQQLPGDEFGDDDDIMDPADIPLCNEFAVTGGCSMGESCLYIHGDSCEICGYFCIHPYNPDITAHHQLVCAEAMAAAAAGGNPTDNNTHDSCNGTAAAAAQDAASNPAPAAAGKDAGTAAAAAVADDSRQVECSDTVVDSTLKDSEADVEVESAAGSKADTKPAVKAADAKATAAAAAAVEADKLAGQLAEAKVSSS